MAKKDLQLTDAIDENLKLVRDSDGVDTPLELSTEKVRVSGELEVNGDIIVNGKLTSRGGGDSHPVTSAGADIDIESPNDIKLNSLGSKNVVSFWSGDYINAEIKEDVLKLFPGETTSGVTDFASLTTGTNGALLIQTTSSSQADIEISPLLGDIILDSADDIILDSHDGQFIMKKAGTEFSAANSAYEGMILGYTRLQGDLTNQSSFEVQNSMTVEDSTHQITFTTPPSENVELEVSCVMNIGSTDTEIDIGVSDSSTYNSIGAQFEYDGAGVIFSDDEADDHIIVAKFILGASELAAIGSSNTFYIGFSTAGATKTAFIIYGLRASHGICDHPFTIKATALPATIYDGL